MCDDSPIAPKWTCEYCTYENFQSAHKCTMCRGAKPLLGEDIYSLRDDSPPVSLASGPSPSIQETNGKWSCETCTYLNWPRAKECAECRSPRVTATNLHEHLHPLRIEHSESASNFPRLGKWTCPGCTYENWPKAVKCIMCATQASHLRLSPSTDTSCNTAANAYLISPERDILRTATIEEGAHILKRSSSRRLESDDNTERQRLRQRTADWSWLNACLGVVHGDSSPVEAFLSSGGDPSRQLTQSEAALLNRPSAFDTGHTLVHLAIRFHREDLLATLLSRIEGSGTGVKRVPSYVAPDLAADIRRYAASTMRQRKGSLPCPFVTEITTFSLPAEIEELAPTVQEQLFEELLDKDVQQQLEGSEPAVINWSLAVTERLGSRLYALWNRSAGDCLLDSLMQTTWGVFDRDNLLRRALSDSLNHAGHLLYPRWREYETCQARLMHFSLEETQWEEDWAGLVRLASQPGASLEQLHVFALAHVLRRPIIVYGVKYVKSFRGEDIGYARFEGVYLPLLWEPTFCVRSPLALGYTRGHFSALVPIKPYPTTQGANNLSNADHLQVTFLPLMDSNKKLLPVHFVMQTEMGREEILLRQWLDVGETEGRLLVAQQHLHKRPLLVAQMLEEWLNHYRTLAQMSNAPFVRPLPVQDYSSDGDSDDE